MSSFGGIELPEWVGDFTRHVELFTSGRPPPAPEEQVLSTDTLLLRESCALHRCSKEAARVPNLTDFDKQERQRLTSLAHDYVEYELARLSRVLGTTVKIGNLRNDGTLVDRIQGVKE
jgi:hypothetical protein